MTVGNYGGRPLRLWENRVERAGKHAGHPQHELLKGLGKKRSNFGGCFFNRLQANLLELVAQ